MSGSKDPNAWNDTLNCWEWSVLYDGRTSYIILDREALSVMVSSWHIILQLVHFLWYCSYCTFILFQQIKWLIDWWSGTTVGKDKDTKQPPPPGMLSNKCIGVSVGSLPYSYMLIPFYAQQHMCYSAYMPRQFRPSVRLSVRFSHACIVSNRLNVSSKFFHHLIGLSC